MNGGGDGVVHLAVQLGQHVRVIHAALLQIADGGSLDDVAEMIASPLTLSGLSDAGAHCNTLSDGTMPTTAISHWTRDRTHGATFALEHMVHRQTQATAAHVGLHDRGVVAPGYLADLNIFDHETINAYAPELVQDLPAGGTRLLQRSTGYRATIKRGTATVEDGELTPTLKVKRKKVQPRPALQEERW